MPKIDLMPEYRANLPRTGHSLSHDFGFTATCAHLLPVFHDFLNPGESVTLGFDFMLRTQPLDSAAMSKLKTHTEYFFVPMQLLYQGFSDWYYGIQEEFSSKFLNTDGLIDSFNLPKVNLEGLFSQLYALKNQNYVGSGNAKTFLFESVANNAYRFFDMLGFRADRIMNGSSTDAAYGSIFPYQILAYNCIYQNYYRLDTREVFRSASFNWDQYYDQANVDPSKFTAFSLLHYRPFDDDYFTNVKVSPIVDVLNLNNKNSLGVASSFLTRGYIGSSSVLSSGSNLSSAPFASYDPSTSIQTQFGFNRYLGAIGNQKTSPNNNYHYVSDNVNYPPSDGSAHFDDGLQGKLADVDDHNIEHDHTFSVSYYANGLDIGTANIRAMFASEKLWSITGRAKKNYDDQTMAHFGYKVPHDPKHQISCFGHDTSEIHIGEVISTANTGDSGSPLGEIAGKGYGAQKSTRHKFTAPCHGVIMVIFSVVPEEYYERTFLKANKLSDRSDLYTPEYDHLGMQPLYYYEHSSLAGNDTAMTGWQYRYEQWKRRYNRVTSAFSGSGTLYSWIHSIRPYKTLLNSATPNTITYDAFMHYPDELNDIMLVSYTNTYSTDYATSPSHVYNQDPFVVSSHIDCVKVSTMSDYSLPRLDS